MYIRQARLKDVKCFADVELRFQSAAETGDRQSNWNVILGENGDGKTTLLQAIAACLMDATTADRMLRPAGWVRGKAEIAALEATLVPDEVDWLPRSERMHPRSPGLALRYEIVRAGARRPGGGQSDVVDRLVAPEPGDPTFADVEILKGSAFQRGASPRGGWFSAGYGPFRRLPGELDRAPRKDALEARFATLFDESASLTDCEDWLKDLDRKAAKTARGSVSRRVLSEVTGLLSKILQGVEIHVEDEIRFVREGVTLSASQLSHGYRSMFAMTVDILRGLWTCRPGLKPPLHRMPGVVLIDEIDAHLHPEWQREAGFTLCNTFENVQFIVTSHSPFVAMAAGKGALTLLERENGMVRAKQDLPYVRGWAVDRVLSQLFGQHSLRDPETEQKLEEYEKLRADRRRRALPKEKASRLAELEGYLEERLRGDRDSLTNRRIDDSLAYFARALEDRGEKPSA